MPPLASRPRPTRATRAFASTLLAVFVAATITTACSLDWNVRPDPGEAAAPPTESGVDAPIATDAADAAIIDAPPGVDSAACDALVADVDRTRTKARECQLAQAGQCTTTVPDECACDVIVRTAGSAEATSFKNAVAALLAACGPPTTCTACPQLGIPASWGCLQPTTTAHCTPPSAP